ncbi:MAG TPA: SPW repeat protein [Verrucomicrobiae bacterium]|jgi:hypothetical protein
MKILPTRVHGMLDYPVGLILLLAPNIFGFADAQGAAVWVPRVIGILTLIQSLMTRYELGLVKVLPMRMHLGVDYAAGILLAASPWLFRFYDPTNQRLWVPHVIAGVAIFLVTLMTEREPRATIERPRAAHA